MVDNQIFWVAQTVYISMLVYMKRCNRVPPTLEGFEAAILHGFSFPSRDTVEIASGKITL